MATDFLSHTIHPVRLSDLYPSPRRMLITTRVCRSSRTSRRGKDAAELGVSDASNAS